MLQAETETKVAEVCTKIGISNVTFYKWNKEYGGLGVGEMQRFKKLQEENWQFKNLVADLSLYKQMFQVVDAKIFQNRPKKDFQLTILMWFTA